MSELRTYTIIYIILFVFATVQIVFERLDSYIIGVTGMMILSTIKAGLVGRYYQHLKDEPRSITYLYLIGVVIALFLTAAAAYSIL